MIIYQWSICAAEHFPHQVTLARIKLTLVLWWQWPRPRAGRRQLRSIGVNGDWFSLRISEWSVKEIVFWFVFFFLLTKPFSVEFYVVFKFFGVVLDVQAKLARHIFIANILINQRENLYNRIDFLKFIFLFIDIFFLPSWISIA